MAALRSESEFTLEATHECARPDWWHAWDDHSAEYETAEFLGGLVRLLQPQFCIETGTAFGHTAEFIGDALLANAHGGLWTYEVDKDRAKEALARTKGLPVTVLHASSIEFKPTYPMAPIDFAFFDSTFELRIPEFRHFRQWMHSNTVVAFHDTAPLHGGGQVGDYLDLRAAITAELSSELSLIHLPTPRGLTIGRVK